MVCQRYNKTNCTSEFKQERLTQYLLFPNVAETVPFSKWEYCYFSSSSLLSHLVALLHNLPKKVKQYKTQHTFPLMNHFGTGKHTCQIQAANLHYIFIKGYKNVAFTHQHNKVRSSTCQGYL